MEPNEDIYEQLMLKQLDQGLTKEEQTRLSAWLAASPEHRQQFEQLKHVWQITSPASELIEPNYNAAWEKVAARTGLEQPAGRRQPADQEPATDRRQSADRDPIQRAASNSRWLRRAVVLLPVLLLLFIVLWLVRPQSSGAPIVLLSEAGQTRVASLPDGSFVRLNGEARLTYNPSFANSDRTLELEGEAFFSVNTDDLPFVITGPEANVTVLGTRFNVNVALGVTRVAVQEGRVRVGKMDTFRDLGPGEGVEVDQNTEFVPLDAEAIQQTFGWMDRPLSYNQTPLTDVILEVSGLFDTPIQVMDSTLAERTVTGSIAAETVQEALTILCLSVECTPDFSTSPISITP